MSSHNWGPFGGHANTHTHTGERLVQGIGTDVFEPIERDSGPETRARKGHAMGTERKGSK